MKGLNLKEEADLIIQVHVETELKWHPELMVTF